MPLLEIVEEGAIIYIPLNTEDEVPNPLPRQVDNSIFYEGSP